MEKVRKQEEVREVTFDDINPLDYAEDRLTKIDEMKREYVELKSRINKREAEEAEALKAQEKAKDEEERRKTIESEAERLIYERSKDQSKT